MKDITFILIRHGLHQLASMIGTPVRYRLRRLWPPSQGSAMSQAARLRLAFQELGPIFIKLGQFIANRPDIFPDTMVDEFARLEDRVEPIPFADVRGVIEAELKGSLASRFRSVDEKPLASASIAQIHRAVTLSGDEVILKVQKPGIMKIIESDMEILALVAEALARHVELEALDPEGLVAEVRRSLERELNFTFERNALDRVRSNFEGDPVLVVPRTYPLLSSRRLLVMQFLDGTAIRHCELSPDQAQWVARESTRILFEMIFRDGYFHADPHPANILFLGDGRLGWIDFGSMGLFTRSMRQRLVRLLRGMLERDFREVAHQVQRLGRPQAELNTFEFTQDLATRLDPYFGLTLREIDVGSLFSTVLELARDHHIRIASGFIIMTRCLVLMEGLAQRLDPEFDTMGELEPLARRYFTQWARPDRVIREAGERLSHLLEGLIEVPEHSVEVMRKLAQGRFQVDTHLQGLERFGRRIESSSNRIVQALVVSSLLISSSLIMNMDMEPTLWGFPALGVAGYVFAALIGVRILVSMMKH